MKKLLLLAISICLLGIFSTPTGATESAKDYSDCPTNATVGRCADKCDYSTEKLQGYDRETGEAICTPNYHPACPYADSQPLESAACQKLILQNQSPVVAEPTEIPANSAYSEVNEGK